MRELSPREGLVVMLAATCAWLGVVLAVLVRRRRTERARAALQGQVGWVTGASQGLGETLAVDLAKLGCRLVLTARREAELERVKARCLAEGRGLGAEDVQVLPLDFYATSLEDLKSGAAMVPAVFGRLDFLVHNAGASQASLAERTAPAVDERMFRLNVLAPIALTKGVLGHMLGRRKGQIVVISSAAGKVASPGQASYSASKFAVQGFFATLAAEVADRGVGCTLCCPGPIEAVEGQQRNIFGAAGLQAAGGPVRKSSSRMPGEEVSRRVVDALAVRAEEVWITAGMVRGFMWLAWACPPLWRFLLRKIGPKRAKAQVEGSGYSLGRLLFGGGGGEKAD